jgi:hypothetical protein
LPLEGTLFFNPYSWIFLSGLFAGACLGRLPFLFRRDRRRSGWSRWISLGAVFLSLAIIGWGLALFIPRGGLFSREPLDLAPFQTGIWLIPFGIALVPGILGFRFPRAAGIPLVVVACTAGVFFFLGLQSFRSVESGTLLDYQLLKIDGDTRVIRLLFPDEREMILTLEGRHITPQFEIITAPVWFFPLSPGRFCRISRLERADPPEPLDFQAPSDTRPFWGDLLAQMARVIPFIRYEQQSFQDGFTEGSGSFIMDQDGALEFQLWEP